MFSGNFNKNCKKFWVISNILMIRRRRKRCCLHTPSVQSPLSLLLQREQIRLCTALKCLWLWFDGKLIFKEHAKRTAAKAEKVVAGISRLMSNLEVLSEGKCKRLANVAMLVLLYEAPIWADAINAKKYWRTEMVSVQRKAVLRCVSTYRIVSTEAVCVLTGILPIEIVVDEHKRVYRATHQISSKSGKVLRVRLDERQVMLHKWKELLLGSSKGEWTHLLTHNLKVKLERCHGQTNFYLTQVMSGHRAFNVYLFHMKLAKSPECTNCDRRWWDDDAWLTLFECLAFNCTRMT